MANSFDIKIFGTTHSQPQNNLFIFNLHILNITPLVVPTTFNMFLSFYAFPFNTSNGTSILAVDSNGDELNNRFLVKKPQVVHINTLSPTISPQLFNCNIVPQNPPIGCNGSQLSIISSLPSCPSPQDIRIYSNTFCVPIIGNQATPTFDDNWTNITNTLGQRLLTPSNSGPFLMPAGITIISDGCYYLSPKNTKITIYSPFAETYPIGQYNPYGQIDCTSNPNLYGIGKDDIITVS